MLIGAYCQFAAKLLAIDHDCSPSGFARHHWFSVRVLDHGVKIPNVAALYRSGPLLLGIAPAILDLDEAGMRCNLPVKECLNLAVVAGGVETLVALSRFHNYSFGNILEIARQRPTSTRVAGLYAWNQ
jgi:hypothetical protein